MTETQISETVAGGVIQAEQVDALVDQLMESSDATAAQLASEGGLLQQLSKALIERALQDEMSEHLGMTRETRPQLGQQP